MFLLNNETLVCERKFDWFVYLTGQINGGLFDINGNLRPIIQIMTSKSIFFINTVIMRISMLLYNITYKIMSSQELFIPWAGRKDLAGINII